VTDLIPLIVLAPLAGFIINGLLGSKMKGELPGWIATLAVLLSFVVSAGVFIKMLGRPHDQRAIHFHLLDWMNVGSVNVGISYLIDQLSIIFMLVITGVGTLIHLYSIGYMKGDRSFWRFFTYLNLFIVMMLQLVMADNFLLTFLGWEGVGLASYLLIGFWYEEKKNGDAAKKAFIVNRIGDFGFLVAMGAMLFQFGSLNYLDVLGSGGNVVDGIRHAGAVSALATGESILTIITLMLFLGCCGKSAQIPLYTWLPDAMAGPTPVSALIHAATMVTSGIFLIARTNVMFAMSPDTMMVVATVGAITALFAATIGIFQNDIKKVLAYSTVSQLGYMFLALGVGSITAGVFHVVTHAFFKACLFLGSGAVIHAMHHEQDMQKMGGLKKYLPITFTTFLIATLAIAGIPPFAGFFSKDEILWMTFNEGHMVLWVIGLIVACMTAFYMFRAVFLTFYGKERFDAHHHPPHEVSWHMFVPLIVLAALSLAGGFLNVPYAIGGGAALHHWLEPVVGRGESIALKNTGGDHHTIALIGIFFATRIYKKKTTLAANEAALGTPYKLAYNKFYVDEIYDGGIVQPTYKISRNFLWKIIDVKVIDGIVNGMANTTGYGGQWLRKIQTGIVQNYAIMIAVGMLVLVSYFLM
jgi:NADH-quinone oxidoreductase subunit L